MISVVLPAARTSAAAVIVRSANIARLRGARGATCISEGSIRAGFITDYAHNTKRMLRTSPASMMTRTSLKNTRSDGRFDSLLTSGACMLLAAVAVASCSPQPVEARWWSFLAREPRDRGSRSPFDDVVPSRVRKQRAQAEAEMRAYMEKMRVPVQELMSALREGKVTREEFDRKIASVNDEVEMEMRRIVFGVQADSRQQYEAEFGNCRYTPEAIKTICALSPLVEFRADRGHWQRELTAAGAAILSYVPWKPHPHSDVLPSEMGKVLPGDETAIRMHQDKTLLLIYPPPGDMSLRCLQEYRGDALVYVGEGRGGVNSCDDFFDRLDAEWEVVTTLDLDPFPRCFEKLFVLRRNRIPLPQEVGRASSGNGE